MQENTEIQISPTQKGMFFLICILVCVISWNKWQKAIGHVSMYLDIAYIAMTTTCMALVEDAYYIHRDSVYATLFLQYQS